MSTEFVSLQKDNTNNQATGIFEQAEYGSTDYTSVSTQQKILTLQRTIGNRAVQRLLNIGDNPPEPSTLPRVKMATQPTIQRCTCGKYNGFHDEQSREDTTEKLQPKRIQRSEDNVMPEEIPTINVGCVVEEDTAYGTGSFNMHGKTDATYNKGEPIPEPFPDTVEVTTSKIRGTDVFSAKGTFDVTYDVATTVTLPTVPDGLSDCQKEAVQQFIDGPLNDHEQEHVAAYEDNYNGTKTISINYKNIKDTPEQRKNALQKPTMDEHNIRTGKAGKASKKLDPWNKDIPGLDCDVESEDAESESDTE